MAEANCCQTHDFCDIEEVHALRRNLLQWYGARQRELPWRTIAATETDRNVRAYAVWVSEVMLQQTQVATVVDYFNRWMERWPTVDKLAGATTEEVREVWAGLGYYSRGRRLLEGAKKVVEELGGVIPSSVPDLMSSLPGVGRYTASAIASIAFKEVCGVVDGNVVRVLSRLRAIGADSSSQAATTLYWKLVGKMVDPGHPGDFNQAIMELGATVCSPRSPTCQTCPLRDHCRAYLKVQSERQAGSLEWLTTGRRSVVRKSAVRGDNKCALCLPPDQSWDPSLGVMNYPRKSKKKPPKLEHFAISVTECTSEQPPMFLLRQRPETGLLAGLWDFPSVPVQPDWSEKQMWRELNVLLGLSTAPGHRHLGAVMHVFSHTHHHYHVWHVKVGGREEVMGVEGRWVNEEDLLTSAISTGVKKTLNYLLEMSFLMALESVVMDFLQSVPTQIFKLVTKSKDNAETIKTSRKRKSASEATTGDSKKQKTMDKFITTSTRKTTRKHDVNS